jgi:transposase
MLRSVGARLGLTTGRYQSGEVDYDGHVSRRGDAHLRGLLFEAATVILTRSSADSSLRSWGLKLRERLGFQACRGRRCAQIVCHYARDA